MFSLFNMCFSWIETAQPVGNLCCGKGGSEWYFLIKKKKGISSIVCTLLGEELSAPGEFSGCWAMTAAVASLLAAFKQYIALLGRWRWRQSTTFSNVIQSSMRSIQVTKETSNWDAASELEDRGIHPVAYRSPRVLEELQGVQHRALRKMGALAGGLHSLWEQCCWEICRLYKSKC